MEKVIIISAPSGTGKTTIIKKIMETTPTLAFSVSATSRKKRKNEVDGIDYYFISEEEFSRRIEKDEFLEWVEVYKNIYYGTLKKEIERLWNENKAIIFDVDVLGGIKLKEYFKDKALAFFIKTPSLNVLKERLSKRATEDEASIALRVERASEELSKEGRFDVSVVNDQLEKTVSCIKEKILRFIDE